MSAVQMESLPADAEFPKDFGKMTIDELRMLVTERQTRRFRLGETADGAFKDLRAKWEERWCTDYSGLWVPEHQENFGRMLIIPQGMRPNKAMVRLKEKPMPTWQYTDDLDTISSSRPASVARAVWVRDRQEADEEWMGKLFNDCVRALVNGITLVERLVFEEDWFDEHHTHLDEQNVTRCDGSCSPFCNVPGVGWGGGEVRVYCYGLGNTSVDLRVREVVS